MPLMAEDFHARYAEWLNTLREIGYLAERYGCSDAPPLKDIHARIPYWIHQLLAMLDNTSELAFVLQCVGRGSDGGNVFLQAQSPRATGFLNQGDPHGYNNPLLAWHLSKQMTQNTDDRGLSMFNDVQPYEAFSSDFIGLQEEYLSRHKFIGTELLVSCMHAINEYETVGPPHGTNGIYDTFNGPPYVLLPKKLPVDTDQAMDDYITDPVPSGFANSRGTHHEEIHGYLFTAWFLKRPFKHVQSDCAYGGDEGVRLGMLMILRSLFHLFQGTPNPDASYDAHSSSSPYQPQGTTIPEDTQKTYIIDALIALRKHVKDSHKSLLENCEDRRLSIAAINMISPMLTFDESKASPRIPRTKKTDQAMELIRAVLEPKDTPRSAQGSASLKVGSVNSGASSSTQGLSAVQNVPRSGQQPRKMHSAPALSSEHRHASPSTGPLVQDSAHIAQSTATDTPGQSRRPSGSIRPVTIVHSPPSTEARSTKKPRRPTDDPLAKQSAPSSADSGAAKKGKEKAAGNLVYQDEDQEVGGGNGPEAVQDEAEEEEEEPPRRQTRSTTSKSQSASESNRHRATSTASAVTENPPPEPSREPNADSSWALPAGIDAVDLAFDIFGTNHFFSPPITSTPVNAVKLSRAEGPTARKVVGSNKADTQASTAAGSSSTRGGVPRGGNPTRSTKTTSAGRSSKKKPAKR